ncbi:MAG TPA: hypothetical protein VGR62_25000 [Candidatus Binatia bacterium]|nr:hypothetical protein [Candidatus Binatia bacterium]
MLLSSYLAACLLVAAPRDAWARASLTSLFDQVLEFGGELDNSPQFRSQLERLIFNLERNAVRTADFVATAASPGFAYEYDLESGVFRRTDAARGPVYVEPVNTVGEGKIDVRFAYLYSDFSELDGESLDDALDFRARRGADILDVRSSLGLRTQVFSMSGTYGITSRWDVNLLVPVLLTALHLNGAGTLKISGADDVPNAFFADASRLGVGDILVRTKYRLPSRWGFDFASALTLRVPSGNPDNFQGLGAVTLTPLFVVQRAIGPHSVEANLGVEADATNVGQSRARYAIGACIRLYGPVTLLAHVIGNSGFEDDHFSEDGVSGVVGRTDIVDAVTGVEVAITDAVVAHVGVIVPLTDDGLRADVVPAAGLGVRF